MQISPYRRTYSEKNQHSVVFVTPHMKQKLFLALRQIKAIFILFAPHLY